MSRRRPRRPLMPVRPHSRRPVNLKTPTSRWKRLPSSPARLTPPPTTGQPETGPPSAATPAARAATPKPKPKPAPSFTAARPGSGAPRRRSPQRGRPSQREGLPRAPPASTAAAIGVRLSETPVRLGPVQWRPVQSRRVRVNAARLRAIWREPVRRALVQRAKRAATGRHRALSRPVDPVPAGLRGRAGSAPLAAEVAAHRRHRRGAGRRGDRRGRGTRTQPPRQQQWLRDCGGQRWQFE